jgi:transcriptional regulator with XRE-family HTH domain
MYVPVSTIKNRLWISRMKRGMPRKQLAALLGHKTTSQLCRWEEGSQLPNLCNALLLSHFLQMPVEFLFKDLRNDLVRRTKHFQATRNDP